MTTPAGGKTLNTPQKVGQWIGHLLPGSNTAWTVLVLSLCATLWAWYATRDAAEEKARLLFDFRVHETENAILKRMQDYEQVLRGAAGLFAASQKVDREEWKAYIASLNINERYPGIQGIGFAPWIPSAHRAAHVRLVRADGFPGYDIQPPGNREHSTPTMYLEPFSGRNLRAFGYDMFSETVRRHAMERARDNGTPILSGKVLLVQETDKNIQAGTLLFLPVYKNGMPHNTITERRAALIGFIYSPFRMNNLMNGILGHGKSTIRTDIDVEIFDGTPPSPRTLLYDDDSVLHAADANYTPLFKHSSTINVQGNAWTLYFFTLPPFESMIETQKPIMVLAAGLLSSCLLFGLITLRKKAEDDLRRFNEMLEQRITERTHQLEIANQELESFSYSVAHDLRAPLRALSGFSQILTEDYAGTLDANATGYLNRIHIAGERMGQLVDDLLKLSRVARTEMKSETLSLSDLAKKIHADLQQREPERTVTMITGTDIVAQGDPRLLEAALGNLLINAWKFTLGTPQPIIEFGETEQAGETVYFIRDNGVGFNMNYVNKLFKPFERLHADGAFAGTGIGLSIVSRIIARHGGRVWAEGAEGKGATFYFTLPAKK